ncbi:DUF3168 domain-containing protein [Sphingomonas cannabina]|uniref:tail completion protein gp17 n=1 Tax=Sphingomonas cannabina TaxID=2899123 RepID=UPI001F1A349E|nr:DUF3168 domain-containing protein [Sphingomonas cannabina]UIJ43723.1 DUF3168 domain-containing protein [Sphingomonas cannabina]
MSMTAALRDRLISAGLAEGRVYRDERLQSSPLPALVLFVVSDPRPSTYDGRQDLRETRVQFDCMGSTRGDADALAEQVINTAEGAVTIGNVRFHRIFFEGPRHTWGLAPDGSRTFVSSLDGLVWHSPAN